jgi:peptidoglycan/xylan/chitin deacetylase (PgdA/CDA1 family)
MTTYVWSIDDAGFGGANLIESLERMTAFFTSRNVPSTWFAIPKPNGQALTPAWRKALRAAQEAGHELQLHGLTHADCYEFGPPAWPATAILSTLQPDFDRKREELLPRYSLENLRARLEAWKFLTGS